MKWRTLVKHTSKSNPELTFWYEPLGRRMQQKKRSEYPQFGSPFNLLATVLLDRLVVVSDDDAGRVYSVAENAEAWERLPRASILEVGALVLGWTASDGEDGRDFASRVKRELHEASSSRP